MKLLALIIVMTEVASFVRVVISDPPEETITEILIATYCISLVASVFYLWFT